MKSLPKKYSVVSVPPIRCCIFPALGDNFIANDKEQQFNNHFISQVYVPVSPDKTNQNKISIATPWVHFYCGRNLNLLQWIILSTILSRLCVQLHTFKGGVPPPIVLKLIAANLIWTGFPLLFYKSKKYCERKCMV